MGESNPFESVLFEMDIGVFRDYLETMEEFLKAEAQHLAKTVERLRANSDAVRAGNEPSREASGERGLEEDDESLSEEELNEMDR